MLKKLWFEASCHEHDPSLNTKRHEHVVKCSFYGNDHNNNNNSFQPISRKFTEYRCQSSISQEILNNSKTFNNKFLYFFNVLSLFALLAKGNHTGRANFCWSPLPLSLFLTLFFAFPCHACQLYFHFKSVTDRERIHVYAIAQ